MFLLDLVKPRSWYFATCLKYRYTHLICSSNSDVEDFASYFYQGLQQRLPEVATLPDHQMTAELQALVTDKIIYANVHCPTAVDVSRRHLDAVWDMTNG